MLEILGKIGFDTKLAIANMVNFIVVFLVLRSLVFKPIREAIEERQKKINEGLSFADDAKERMAEAMAEKESILQSARGEADTLIKSSTQKAKNIEDSAVQKSQESIEKMKQEAIQEIERKESDSMNKLRSKAGELALDMAEKIIKSDDFSKDRKQFSENMSAR